MCEDSPLRVKRAPPQRLNTSGGREADSSPVVNVVADDVSATTDSTGDVVRVSKSGWWWDGV